MWYLANYIISLILGFYMFVSKVHKNFFPKIWGMVEKIKTNVVRLLLVSKMKKSSIQAKYMENFFSYSKPKVVYLHPVSSSLEFPKF